MLIKDVVKKIIFSKNSEQEFMSVIKLKPNLCTTYIKLCKHFGRRKTDRNKIAIPIEH